MRRSFIISFFILSAISAGLTACEDSITTDEPMDLVKGDVDLKQEYYKSQFKNPMTISGIIKDVADKALLSGATITARLDNSTTKYSTTSKSDGTYELYVDGANTYIIYAEKSGYDKNYYFETTNDSTTVISTNRTSNISLTLHDPTPTFKVNSLAIKSTGKYLSDLSFNGTYLVSSYYGNAYAYHYDASGNYLKSTPFIENMDFIVCQDTIYWTGSNFGNTLYKVGQKGGKTITSVATQTSTFSYLDIDVYENAFWIITSTILYKVSLKGEVLMTVDLSKSIKGIKMVGITHKDSYLFLLSNVNGTYVLHKIDPATGTVLSKGIFPSTLNNMGFKSLAYDQKNFWTITYGTVSTYFDLVKLSITE